MPPRYARGRSSPTSPQEGAMNSIVEKGASKGALFLLALQSSFLYGLFGCALTPLRMANAILNESITVSCVRRLGGKPARAEADGDAAAKKRACKLFLPLCVPTACARGLVTERRPRAQRGGTP